MRLRKMMAILLALCTVFFLAGCGGGGGGGGSDEEEEAATWPVEFYSEVGGGSPVSAIRVAPATGTYKYIYFYKNKKYESGDLNNGILTKTGEGSYLGGDPHNNVTISLTGTFEGSTLIGESVTISSGSLTVAGVSFTRSTSSNGGSNGGNGGNNGGGSTPASTVPLCFTAADGDVEVYVYIKVDGDRTDVPRFEWSSDGVAWSPVETWNKSKTDYLITTLTSGSKMYIRALDSNNFLYSLNASGIINTRFKFAGTGTVAASGNVMSLLDKNNTLNAIPSVKCFYNLFAFCGKLTSAPELPATTLTDYCYQSMFQDCTSLTSAPKLPATTLADYCYFSMFEGCSSLKSMRVDFTSWINTSSTERWVTDVGSGGTFICPVALLEEIGTKNLPNDWELQVFGAEDGNGGSTPASTVPLCFTAAGGNVEVSLYIRVDGDRTDVPSFEWSSDGVAWSPVETWNKSKTDYLITTLTSGSKMYIRALDSNNFLYSLNASGIINTRFKFAGTGTVAASGNVMSLLDKN
ncbi:MAG: hypothetical protein IKO95_03480, partial [Spirochaetia bacterium]|nr:hypothetical protein [Spirochaetia bacterium]